MPLGFGEHGRTNVETDRQTDRLPAKQPTNPPIETNRTDQTNQPTQPTHPPTHPTNQNRAHSPRTARVPHVPARMNQTAQWIRLPVLPFMLSPTILFSLQWS